MKPPAERPARDERAPRVYPIVPTLLTLGNAVCGFAAIACVYRHSESDPPVALLAVTCLIYAAMIFDAFDGLAARLMNQSSQFGAQLDSLSDAISFGVAPALLMVQFSTRCGHSPYLLWPIATAYVICTLLRLARFNAELGGEDRPRHFFGLPSPAAAGTVAAFPLLASGSRPWETGAPTASGSPVGPWLDVVAGMMPMFTLVVACLMVSRVRYAHIGRHLAAGRRSGWYPVRLAVTVMTVSLLPQTSAALLFGWYTFVTPFRRRQS